MSLNSSQMTRIKNHNKYRQIKARPNSFINLQTNSYLINKIITDTLGESYCTNDNCSQIAKELKISIPKINKKTYSPTYKAGKIEGDLGILSKDMHKIAWDEYKIDDLTLKEAMSKTSNSLGVWNTIRVLSGKRKDMRKAELKLSKMKIKDMRFFAYTKKGAKFEFSEHNKGLH